MISMLRLNASFVPFKRTQLSDEPHDPKHSQDPRKLAGMAAASGDLIMKLLSARINSKDVLDVLTHEQAALELVWKSSYGSVNHLAELG